MSDETLVPTPRTRGRYEIVSELGRGGMGVVYEAFDPVIKRRVAIKTARLDVFAQAGQAEEMMTRFIREAQAAGALNHPNIITIYDTGEHEGISFIVMEFIEGGDLHDQLAAGHRWDPNEVVELGAALAAALAAAHEQGIVHRDIKPANIMLPTRGQAKIADFGIAHVSDSKLTRQGDMIGTPYYMSPEQFMGQKADARSDLFSLAIILYEMLTGERPFRGQALNTVMHECLKTVPTPPQELNFAVPPALGAVILKALEKSPLHRYQNGTAFAEALRESVKETPNPVITKVGENDATVIGERPAPGPNNGTDLEVTELGATSDPLEPDVAGGDTSDTATQAARWTRAHTAIAGVSVLVLVAFGYALVPKDEPSVPGEEPYYGTLNLNVYGDSDPNCDYDPLNIEGTTCFDREITVTATICNADAETPDDCIEKRFTDSAVIKLGGQKRWRNIAVRLTSPNYVPNDATTTVPASTPDESYPMQLVLTGKDKYKQDDSPR